MLTILAETNIALYEMYTIPIIMVSPLRSFFVNTDLTYSQPFESKIMMDMWIVWKMVVIVTRDIRMYLA